MNKKLFSIILSIFLLIPSFSYAICEGRINPCPPDFDGDGRYGEIESSNEDIDGDGRRGEKEICNFCHLFEITNNIIVYFITCVTPIVSGIMLILGGFYFMIAGVDPSKLQQGKEIIKAAIFGLVIIFVSWVLLNSFLASMGIAEWTGLGSWWEFRCY